MIRAISTPELEISAKRLHTRSRSRLSSTSNSRRVSVRTDFEDESAVTSKRWSFTRKRRAKMPEIIRHSRPSASSFKSEQLGPKTTKTAVLRQKLAIEQKKNLAFQNSKMKRPSPAPRRLSLQNTTSAAQPVAVPNAIGCTSEWRAVPIDKNALKLDLQKLSDEDDGSGVRRYAPSPPLESKSPVGATASSTRAPGAGVQGQVGITHTPAADEADIPRSTPDLTTGCQAPASDKIPDIGHFVANAAQPNHKPNSVDENVLATSSKRESRISPITDQNNKPHSVMASASRKLAAYSKRSSKEDIPGVNLEEEGSKKQKPPTPPSATGSVSSSKKLASYRRSRLQNEGGPDDVQSYNQNEGSMHTESTGNHEKSRKVEEGESQSAKADQRKDVSGASGSSLKPHVAVENGDITAKKLETEPEKLSKGSPKVVTAVSKSRDNHNDADVGPEPSITTAPGGVAFDADSNTLHKEMQQHDANNAATPKVASRPEAAGLLKTKGCSAAKSVDLDNISVAQRSSVPASIRTNGMEHAKTRRSAGGEVTLTPDKMDTIRKYLEEQANIDQDRMSDGFEAASQESNRSDKKKTIGVVQQLTLVIEKITEEKRQLTELCAQLLQQMQLATSKLIEIETRQEQSLLAFLPREHYRKLDATQPPVSTKSGKDLHFGSETQKTTCERCQELEKLHNKTLEEMKANHQKELDALTFRYEEQITKLPTDNLAKVKSFQCMNDEKIEEYILARLTRATKKMKSRTENHSSQAGDSKLQPGAELQLLAVEPSAVNYRSAQLRPESTEQVNETADIDRKTDGDHAEPPINNHVYTSPDQEAKDDTPETGSKFSMRFQGLQQENNGLKKQLEELQHRCDALTKLIKLG